MPTLQFNDDDLNTGPRSTTSKSPENVLRYAPRPQTIPSWSTRLRRFIEGKQMSFVTIPPELTTAAAGNLAGIGPVMSAGSASEATNVAAL
jgi:hypothetical protein